MGAVILDPQKVPVNLDGDRIVAREIETPLGKVQITCSSMGNPHCTVIVPDVMNCDVEAWGKAIGENKALFPDGVNVGFMQIIDRSHVKLRVYERGTGETMACGSGACAAAVAAALNGKCDKDADIFVRLLGGELTIRYTDETVYLTGEACEVFRGTVRL